MAKSAGQEKLEALAAIVVSVLLGFLLALAGGQSGLTLGPISVFGWGVLLAFGLQWLVFIPSYIWRTERFYDLTGSLTYLSLIALSLSLSYQQTGEFQPVALLLAGLVSIWALRLGSFLFKRILNTGHDSRFETLKQSFWSFLMAWTLQGLWVCFTLSAALAVISKGVLQAPGLLTLLGGLLWIIGFAFEAVADAQKEKFRRQASSSESRRFIQTGLWAWSRHPNYFGEILLWTGIAIIALPHLQGLQLFTLLSPVFVTVLLTRISGIPMLEAIADERWGGQPDYEAYKAQTPILIPKPPKSS